MRYTLHIIDTPENFDCYNIRFINEKGALSGKGYRSKKTGKMGLLNCPSCLRENYILAVLSGGCAWCDFTIDSKVDS